MNDMLTNKVLTTESAVIPRSHCSCVLTTRMDFLRHTSPAKMQWGNEASLASRHITPASFVRTAKQPRC